MDLKLLKRKYGAPPTKTVSFRLPTGLMERLNKIAEENSYTATDVVITVLDQFVQQMEAENEKVSSKKVKSK
jgi:predicted DNA-binding protein